MLTINDFNYEQYKKVAEVLFAVLTNIPGVNLQPEHHPMAVLERWEKQNMDRAKKGLKIGLMDVIGGLSDASQQQKEEINRQLLDKGLPGLYELLNNVWDVRENVLKKNKIRNLDEYYVISELLSHTDADLTQAERNRLNAAIIAFDTSKSKKKK